MDKANKFFNITAICAVATLSAFTGVYGSDGKDILIPQKGKPFENSLGMKFVPIPGTDVLFCIWETRVRDCEVFWSATGQKGKWEPPDFDQAPEHPSVNVSWHDAVAFCKFLTVKERGEKRIGPKDEYRLPTDSQWSMAAGLSGEAGASPEEKGAKSDGFVYPWGDRWPPSHGAGNYDPSLKADDFEKTSPVGSFTANRHGLYDMGGNVWEWCEDKFNSSEKWRLLRGASWRDDGRGDLALSRRSDCLPVIRSDMNGFRCVLWIEPK